MCSWERNTTALFSLCFQLPLSYGIVMEGLHCKISFSPVSPDCPDPCLNERVLGQSASIFFIFYIPQLPKRRAEIRVLDISFNVDLSAFYPEIPQNFCLSAFTIL